ncbi:MAG TPA: outer membrane beta-barrel protein [Sphingobium sp.]|uniref:outer membrane protein n=1 Tax=Sphingobium sp. TaxID=1912891 RepID=UPI002ED264E3
MFKHLWVTAASVAALASATPAFAQDNSLAGFRIEALAGWDNFSAGSRQSNSKDDIVFGGAAGYDFQFGNIVVGPEAEITGSGVSSTSLAVLNPSDYLRIEATRDLYVGARIGYAFTPKIMVYAKGGYSNLLVKTRYNPGIPGYTGEDRRSSDTDGYRFGAGLEYQFDRNIYAKGEYRYSHYGAIGEHNPDFNIDTDRNQIILGVGYRF